MIEQEVKAWRRRMRRIWGPVVHRLHVRRVQEWVFGAVLKPDVRIEIYGEAKSGKQEFFLRFFISGGRWVNQVVELRAALDETIIWSPTYEEDKELATQFAAEWLPYFRRGCWLSGCDVEATSHEKAEWMRGFGREELEAWDLKM